MKSITHRPITCSTRPARGMTLTEVLVVILIITILAVLSLMIVKNVRRSAQNVGCLNNLRSISNGIELYTQDHNDTLPAANAGPAGQKPPLNHYLIALPRYVYGPDATDKNGNVSVQSGSAFSCPAARHEFKANTMTSTYGFNAGIRFTGTESQLNLRKQAIRHPSHTMILMDGSNAWSGRHSSTHHAYWYFEVAAGGNRRPASNDQKDDFVHNGRINVLFIDGHIESRSPREIPSDSSHVFWNYQGEPNAR